MQSLRFRLMRETDLDTVTELNAAATPAVNLLTRDEVAALYAASDIAMVATYRAGIPVAFLISLAGGLDYASENYAFFESRGVPHQYIDRIVVAPEAKGTGVGRAFYESVFERARERGVHEVTAEVNVRPANPGSLAFHDRLGFQHLGEQETKDGSVRVRLLARSVYDASAA